MNEISTIALSEVLKGELRKERIDKESYETTVTRILADFRAVKGVTDTKTKDEIAALQSILAAGGITRQKVQKMVMTHIQNAAKLRELRLEEDVITERFNTKMNVAYKVSIILIPSVVFLITLLYKF